MNEKGQFWISGTKVFAWILLIVIILSGLAGAFTAGFGVGEPAIGFAILVASALLAFLSVSGIMIFLNLAQDVKDIKVRLEQLQK